MKKPSIFGFLAAGAAALLASAAPASANNVLYDQTSTFPASGTMQQLDRLSRNGIPQDFSGTEAFPGANTAAVNVTGIFNYITITLTPAQLAGGPYVQIELDSQGLFLFSAAYANSYTPPSPTNPSGSFQTNYLGDAGTSGNANFTTLPIAATDVNYFGVTVPTGSSLVVVIATAGAVDTTTNTAAGAGTPYRLEIENFSTTQYGPIAAAPEPSSLAAIGAGMLGLCTMMRFRRRTAAAA